MTDWTRLSAEEIIERFAGITVWKAHGQRAPHKPLLILWVLARLQRGEQSIASFAEIDQPLKTLLQDFGPSRKSYQHRCAVCGFDAMLENSSLGIEAAHIRWHAAAGPDTEDNGLALCSLHHKALDRGAIGLDDQNRILVSQHVRGTSGVEEWLNRFSGHPLRGPQPGCPVPSPEHVRWHRREVFRGPARERG